MFNVQPTRVVSAAAEPLTNDEAADDARHTVEHEVCEPEQADHHSIYFVNDDGTSTWWCDCGTAEDADLIGELLNAHHSRAPCGLEMRGPQGAAHETGADPMTTFDSTEIETREPTTLPTSGEAQVHTSWVRGIEAFPCTVHIEVALGLPSLDVVGLNEASVRETRVRVRCALMNTGFVFPAARMAVSLLPAHQRKDGTGYDLPVAVALLAATGQIPATRLSSLSILGELALDGDVRPVRGVLLAAEQAKRDGRHGIIVAKGNVQEASLVDGLDVYGVDNLRDVVSLLTTEALPAQRLAAPSFASPRADAPDFAEVKGNALGARAMEIAAAGAHHVLLIGGPGSGKTMLARRLPGILPPLTQTEALEVTRLASVSGLNIGGGLVERRPFRAPHHSTTSAGLVGGGAPVARPGELSLAHNGVLMLDELPEFPRAVLEMLREPMESREVSLSRAAGVVTYPARALIVAAMNPCPCGQLGHPRLRCRCSAVDVARYRARAASFVERFELSVDVPPVNLHQLQSDGPSESSASIQMRVSAAREIQLGRQEKLNCELTTEELRIMLVDHDAQTLLVRARQTLDINAFQFDAVRRVARTIADLDSGSMSVGAPHVAEALMLRC